MTDVERRALLGDDAVEAARQSARDAAPPSQALLDAVAVLIAAHVLLPRDSSSPRDAA